LVLLVGQALGVADAAATLLPAALAAALPTVLLVELHAAVKASSAMTRITDNFRNIRYPPD